mgnify:CR=1 FL=1
MSLRNRMRSFDDDIDFRKVWRVGTTLSLCVFLVSLGALLVRGLNLGLDFEGGTAWEVPSSELSIEDARDAMADHDQENAKIQAIGRGDSRVVRVQSDTEDEAVQQEVSVALAEVAGVEPGDITVQTVGPSWGEQVTNKAERAMLWFFLVITLYITWRLEWKMAIGALASVVHDLVISVGVYALFQMEVTPATVIAFLTILGYSLYDTIVVFDRMQENEERYGASGKVTYTGIASLSLNQVLMRSVNTTITALLPVVAMLVVGSFLMGAATLQEFALALTVGLLVGAFSSILIASPLVAWIKDREPRYRTARARLASTAGPVAAAPDTGTADLTPVGQPDKPAKRTVSPGQAPVPSGREIPPRPRKKGKRR